jgi:mono/diheme cytochrome c family protein
MACGASGAEHHVEGADIVPASREEVHGKRLFQKFCYQCHPAGRQGVGPGLIDKPLSAEAIRMQIRAGTGAMPMFGDDWLSDEQVAEIADYVTTLEAVSRTAFR